MPRLGGVLFLHVYEMKDLVDIHCHILPYVDDGALRTQESDELLEAQAEQGVSTICVTPHLRRGMFETPDDKVVLQFERLKERAQAKGLQVTLFLSREYHCDSIFLERLKENSVWPLGNGRYLLSEFSYGAPIEDIHFFIETIKDSGYTPLIAHVERCYNLQTTEQIAELTEMGARLQMNASSILGREGRQRASWCKKLLKAQLIHVVASDAHDQVERPVELAECAAHLERKYGAAYAQALLHQNPLNILNLTE